MKAIPNGLVTIDVKRMVITTLALTVGLSLFGYVFKVNTGFNIFDSILLFALTFIRRGE